MNKITFLQAIEAYSYLIKGNGAKLAKMAGMKYDDYTNLMRGIVQKSDRYEKILAIIKKLHSEHLQKIKKYEEQLEAAAA